MSIPHRLLAIALLMNREWRHQFGPDITIEKGCWNVIVVLPCEETIRNRFFGLTSPSTMKCVGGIKLFSRVYGIRKIEEMLYPSILAFYQINVLYLHSTGSK